MKARGISAGVIAFLLVGLWGFSEIPNACAQASERAKKERAKTVNLKKNRFVCQVLDEYKIAYRIDEIGTIQEVNLDGTWKPVQRIDVVPMTKHVSSGGSEVVGHEVYLFTSRETVRLYSNKPIR